MKSQEYLSSEERLYFTQKNNTRAFLMLLGTWGSIFAIFSVVYLWTNPFSIVLAIVLLAGRQLGLAVLMHDCGHNIFFETKKLNQFVGQWFCANPVLQGLPSYAKGHLNHHKLAGTEADPDLNNYRNYPIDQASFRRKVQRDLTGKTGFKLLRYVLSSALGFFSKDSREFARPFVQELLVQALFVAILSLTMSPYLYVLWMVSWLTVYVFIVRFRQIAEHASVTDLFDRDPRKNTRTTIPNWLERVFIAPNFVNYHLEHHFMASVPCYKLAQLHRLLKSRGAYADTKIAYGYRQVLREAVI